MFIIYQSSVALFLFNKMFPSMGLHASTITEFWFNFFSLAEVDISYKMQTFDLSILDKINSRIPQDRAFLQSISFAKSG